jgi:hypothetical protein
MVSWENEDRFRAFEVAVVLWQQTDTQNLFSELFSIDLLLVTAFFLTVERYKCDLTGCLLTFPFFNRRIRSWTLKKTSVAAVWTGFLCRYAHIVSIICKQVRSTMRIIMPVLCFCWGSELQVRSLQKRSSAVDVLSLNQGLNIIAKAVFYWSNAA